LYSSFVFNLGVQLAALGSGNHDGRRVRTAVLIWASEACGRFFAGLEVIEKTRVNI
jgi:hypothetical protein